MGHILNLVYYFSKIQIGVALNIESVWCAVSLLYNANLIVLDNFLKLKVELLTEFV
jgi:hypothetical protein